MTYPRHLMLVGAGPGLGAATARRFAREGYGPTLAARSERNEQPAVWREQRRFAGAQAPQSSGARD